MADLPSVFSQFGMTDAEREMIKKYADMQQPQEPADQAAFLRSEREPSAAFKAQELTRRGDTLNAPAPHRATFLPAQYNYETGQNEWALPGIVHDGIEGAKWFGRALRGQEEFRGPNEQGEIVPSTEAMSHINALVGWTAAGSAGAAGKAGKARPAPAKMPDSVAFAERPSFQPPRQPDDFGSFLKTTSRADGGASSTVTNAYEQYCAWAERNNHPAMSLKEFQNSMSDAGMMKGNIAGRDRYIGAEFLPQEKWAGEPRFPKFDDPNFAKPGHPEFNLSDTMLDKALGRKDYNFIGEMGTRYPAPANDGFENLFRPGQTLYANDSRAAAPAVMAGQEQKGIRAYHGSPHDFDKFDLSKIGTGEGAQAFGHGLYFAEREGVAKHYRDALGAKGVKTQNMAPDGVPYALRDGINVSQYSGEANSIRRLVPLIEKHAGDLDAARSEAVQLSTDAWDKAKTMRAENDKFRLPWQHPPFSEEDIAKASEHARSLSGDQHYIDNLKATGDKISTKDKLGHMYEVNINADPEHFLDWDKPLAQQPKALDAYRKANPDAASRLDQILAGVPDINAGSLVTQMHTAPERLSSSLREAGIPGIRYLDQGSRTAGEGSSNYVVFDDKLVDILRKYANHPHMAAPALATGQPSNDDLTSVLKRLGLMQ